MAGEQGGGGPVKSSKREIQNALAIKKYSARGRWQTKAPTSTTVLCSATKNHSEAHAISSGIRRVVVLDQWSERRPTVDPDSTGPTPEFRPSSATKPP